MQDTFLTRTRLWLGGIVLLALVVVAPVTPAMAVPISYDLSGPLTGTISLDMELAFQPFRSWNITDGTTLWSLFPGFDRDPQNLVTVPDVAAFLQTQAGGPGGTDLFLYTYVDTFKYNFCLTDCNISGEGPLSIRASGVPESSSILLLATGLLCLAAWQWKRQGTTNA